MLSTLKKVFLPTIPNGRPWKPIRFRGITATNGSPESNTIFELMTVGTNGLTPQSFEFDLAVVNGKATGTITVLFQEGGGWTVNVENEYSPSGPF